MSMDTRDCCKTCGAMLGRKGDGANYCHSCLHVKLGINSHHERTEIRYDEGKGIL